MSTPNRTVAVARIHTPAWKVALVWPLAILTAIFAISVLVLSRIPDQGIQINTGGATFVFFFGMVLFAQTMTQVFPFALGLGVTRREFFTATTGTAVAHAVGFGVLMLLLSLLEQTSDGFGVRMRMFSVVAPFVGGRPVELLVYIALFALCNAVGIFGGSLYMRWRTNGLWAAFLAVLIVVGGAAVVITWQRSWIAFGTAVADAPRLLTVVVLPIALTGVVTAAAWSVLRRSEV